MNETKRSRIAGLLRDRISMDALFYLSFILTVIAFLILIIIKEKDAQGKASDLKETVL